jgi:hypothetical protein
MTTDTNEVSNTPRTDAEITCVGIDGDGDAYLHADFARELERELAEKTNEVARLRELLIKITDLAESLSGYYYNALCDMQECPAKKWGKVHQKLLADNLEHFKKEARLAPAPKEPVNPTCANTTHKFSHCDCEKPTPIEPAPEWRELGPDEVIQMDDMYRNDVSSRNYPVTSVMIGKPVGNFPFPEYSFRTRRPLPKPAPEEPVIKESLTTEPAPEWRDLGPDEVIHTGDQVQAKHHDRIHGVWLDVFPYEVGAMPIDHEAFRYRTRRPLPKQEEMPLEDFQAFIDGAEQ